MSIPKRAVSGSYADKLWRDALRKAALKRVEGEHRLDRIADKIVAKAEEGDTVAAKEIGDRLDGRPAQAVTIDATIHRDPNEISDAELASVFAAGSRAGTVKAKNDKAGLH